MMKSGSAQTSRAVRQKKEPNQFGFPDSSVHISGLEKILDGFHAEILPWRPLKS
jgi:hypothetical protein